MKTIHFLLFLLLFSTTLWGSNPNLVTIRGHILNAQSKLVSINLPITPLSEDTESFAGMLEGIGTFLIQFELTEPTPALFYHANNYADLYLSPGDELFVAVDMLDFENTMRFTNNDKGAGADHNNFWVQHRLMYDSPSANALKQQKVRLDPTSYSNFANENRKKQHTFLAEYKADHPISSDFEAYTLAMIDCIWATDLLDYPFAHTLALNKNDTPDLPPNYYVFLDQVDKKNEQALKVPVYNDFIVKYTSFKFSQSINRATYNADNYYPDRHNFAKQILSNRALYFIQGRNIIEACTYAKIENIAGIYNDFISNNPYLEYTDVVNSHYNKANIVGAGQAAPDFELYTSDNKKVSLSDFQGKIIYIDFWATWCGPCIKEFPKSDYLRKYFRGKDVVFLYISVDEDPRPWEKFIKKKNWGESVHLITYGMQSPICEQYNLKGVPKYMLLDRNGIIIDSNAKRPSEPGIIDDIESALQKQ